MGILDQENRFFMENRKHPASFLLFFDYGKRIHPVCLRLYICRKRPELTRTGSTFAKRERSKAAGRELLL